MDRSNDRPILHIKKYPNRRYYDATKSRHLTLQDVYGLVRLGHELRITGSRSGEDITNAVLLQLLSEREADKLRRLPPSLLHQIIRLSDSAFCDWLASLTDLEGSPVAVVEPVLDDVHAGSPSTASVSD